MADMNIRDFPHDLLLDAKVIAVGQNMFLRDLVIAAVREYCTSTAQAHVERIRQASETVRDTHYEATD